MYEKFEMVQIHTNHIQLEQVFVLQRKTGSPRSQLVMFFSTLMPKQHCFGSKFGTVFGTRQS